MVSIASRSSWGARYANGDKTLYGLASEVFVHHTVTATLSASASVAQERAQMRSIEAIGKSRGFPGMSYNVLIFPSGRAYQGVSWNRRGCHTGGRNSTARSISFAGNFEANQPTAAALATAASIYAYGKGRWWSSSAPLKGHRHVKATACPGKNVFSRLGTIRSGGGSSSSSSAASSGLSQAAAAKAAASTLTADGLWGSTTTARAQKVLKAAHVDGMVSRQSKTHKAANPGLTSGWEWVAAGTGPAGSGLIKAMQKRLGVPQDGKIGPATIKALQKHYGQKQTGTLARKNETTKAMQRALNAGKF